MREQGLIMRVPQFLGGERQRFGQEDVWLVSRGRKEIENAL